MAADLDIVTGAFGYTGKYIARRLLARGRRVKTLTGHPDRADPFGGRVATAPLDFDRPAEICANLRGVHTLYNTYWVRFERWPMTFARAVRNTKVLIDAAGEAGVRRVVHLSIINPSRTSPLPYFSGKAEVEEYIARSAVPHVIIRPALVFGPEDILINNIAWLVRNFPFFIVPGDGAYRLQPVFVEDLADLAVKLAGRHEDLVVDAVGPEVYTFDELVRTIAEALRRKVVIVHCRPGFATAVAALIGRLLGDEMLTADEVRGLSAELLISSGPPTCQTGLRKWLHAGAETLGSEYASELQRHYRLRGGLGERSLIDRARKL